MKRIEDAYKYAGTIIAYTEDDKEKKEGILDNGLTYAKVGSLLYEEHNGEVGLNISTFKNVNSISSEISLTSSTIKDNNFLNVRHANIEEVTKLQELAENDKIKLGYADQKDTNNILIQYLTGDIAPYPYVYKSITEPTQNGSLTHWEVIDPYKMNKESEIIGADQTDA